MQQGQPNRRWRRAVFIEGQGHDFVALSETPTAELPTRSTARSNSSRVTPKLYPVFDLILTWHSNLTTIRHNSLREAASHEIFPLCLDLLSHPPTNARSARRFPRRAITVDFVYFPLRVW